MDTFKAIACFLVVLLHYPMQGEIGILLGSVARIGVPFFLLVSGFFSYSREYDRTRHIKKVGKYCLLLIGVDIVYFSKDLLRILLGKITVEEFISINFTPEFLIANFGSAGHMWFVRALLYLELFQIILGDNINSRKIKYLLPIVWISYIIYKIFFCFGDTYSSTV